MHCRARTTALAALAVLTIMAGVSARADHQRLADARALLLDNEPMCRELAGAGRRVGTIALRRALAKETLAIVEELGSNGWPAGAEQQRVKEHLSAQQALCGSDSGRPAAAAQPAESELPAMSNRERVRRTTKYLDRLERATFLE